MCGACDLRLGSLLLRLRTDNCSCSSFAIARAASRCLLFNDSGLVDLTDLIEHTVGQGVFPVPDLESAVRKLADFYRLPASERLISVGSKMNIALL